MLGKQGRDHRIDGDTAEETIVGIEQHLDN